MRRAAWEQCQGGEEGGMGRGQGVFGVWGEMGTAEVARVRLNQAFSPPEEVSDSLTFGTV